MSRTPLVQVDEPLTAASAGAEVPLPADELHHLTAVLRLAADDPLEVTDGAGGQAPARLADGVAVLTGDAAVVPRPRPGLRVLQALPKGRKLDEVVRACVELGVDELVPVAAARSVRRPQGPRADKAVARWQAVARAAGQQARRRHAAQVAPVAGVADLAVDGPLLVAHPTASVGLPAALEQLGSEPGGIARVGLAVGPEGGWTDDEVARLTAVGAVGVHLGPTVLRTEHAAPAALAVVAAWAGRWR